MAEPTTEEIIGGILKLMNVGFSAIERVESPESNHTRFLVRTDESSLLIGSNGENLSAFNYIIRRIVLKQSGDNPTTAKFFVDVNDYHDKAVEALKMKAKIMGERARSFQIDIELDPMTSYERMLVHSFLEGMPDIKTESKGEGSTRRIVVKYAPHAPSGLPELN